MVHGSHPPWLYRSAFLVRSPFQPDETATGIDFTPWKMAGLRIDA